jgi:UDP-3-O-acyl-N-acetylglucosamine deacetylase
VARLEPYHGYKLTFQIDFNHPAVDATPQEVTFDMGSGRYKQEIARARTFGFTKDVEAMRSRGLTLGGSMDNAIVIDDYRVLNSEACATTTRSPSTRSSTPSATSTSAATRCWRPTPRSRAATP